MKAFRRFSWAGTAAFVLSTAVALSALQKADKDAKPGSDAGKPRVKLSAQPMVSISPSRIVLTAELLGGANDFEEFYCPTVEWEWGDDTTSENATDCVPYESGKSEIKRRFTVEHIFRRPGNFRVTFRLKQRSKAVAFATVTVQVRPGLREGER